MQHLPAIPASPEPAEDPTSALALMLDRAPWMRPHPALVDANAIIQDVLRRCRRPFTAMTFLSGQGFMSLLAPTHVHAEVCEHLPRVAASTGCSAELALHVWQTVHLPLIRFVDVPADGLGDGFDDGRILSVEDADGDDAPFARLSLLVSPSATLTSDRDLTDAGIGDPDWLRTLLILGELAELEAMIWGGSVFAAVGLGLPAAGLVGLGRVIARSPLALGFALGFVFGLAVGALIRCLDVAKRSLAAVGYHHQPPGTIYAGALFPLSKEGFVVIELKDGRRLRGCPRIGPQHKDDGIAELYLTYPEAEGERGQWSSAGDGAIVPLSEVGAIFLSDETTGAPPRVVVAAAVEAGTVEAGVLTRRRRRRRPPRGSISGQAGPGRAPSSSGKYALSRRKYVFSGHDYPFREIRTKTLPVRI